VNVPRRSLIFERLRGLPVGVRVLLLVAITALGLGLGFGLGLGLIRLLQVVLGDFPTHSPRGLVAIAGAYAVTGLSGLAAFVGAWLRLFRRPT